MGVGEEGELEGSRRALDRHLGDVNHETAPFPALQLLGQRLGSLECVELEDAPAPLLAGHPGCLVGPWGGAGGYEQVVVVELLPGGESDLVLVRQHQIDVTDHHFHTRGEESTPRPHHLVGGVGTEGDEQIAGLVVMAVVLIDHGDLPLVGVETRPQLVGHHGPCGACSENEQTSHVAILRRGRTSSRRWVQDRPPAAPGDRGGGPLGMGLNAGSGTALRGPSRR